MLVKDIPEDNENLGDEPELISKSQLRRDALEVKALAARLIGLSPSTLGRLPLSDAVRAAIADAQRIRSNVARKRQLQFTAKILRREDAEPILDALDEIEAGGRQATARQHRVEAWRDHLLTGGDTALGELMAARPTADAQAIRQLLRNAAREAERNKPPAAARSLFRLLRDLDGIEPLPSLTTG